jgi:hypothetical protein
VIPPKKCLPILLLLLLPALGMAQSLSNLKSKTIAISHDTTILDLLSIAPNSERIEISGLLVAKTQYEMDYFKATLIWKGALPADSIRIVYRTLPLNFSVRASKKDPNKLQPDASGQFNPFTYSTAGGTEDFFAVGGLNKSGSISRGIAFGNNQDLSVNSNLSLQLSGRLNERFSVLASVTDDNIPIQPDGNTQQLQDFDQVFIQVYDDKTKIIAGDFQLKRPKSHFLNYFKKAQGGTFETSFGVGRPLDPNSPEKKAMSLKMKASIAASRGKFSRMIIQGIEGNQGPYRLRGAANETFIIVLSGTERLFIDGEQLVRGQDNDYVIDYNTAEVTFTPNRLITKDKRITIEFQYSDKNYARSLLQYSSELTGKKFELNFNLYTEQDSKNQPLQQDLDDSDRDLLSSVGDDLGSAVVNSIDSGEFSNDFVLYALIDTLGYDSVLLNTNSADSAFYRASFTNVGAGNGFYNKTTFTASGAVFQWIAPDTVGGFLIPKGEYEPVRVLLAPKQNQMVTIGGEYRFNKRNKTGFELAISNADINTFSSVDAGDDVGYAIKVYGENRTPLQSKAEPWTLVSNADFEMVERRFAPIERFRPVEFERNWNVTNSTALSESQYLTSAGLGVQKKGVGTVRYLFDALAAGSDYTGIKNNLLANVKGNGYRANISGSYLLTKGTNRTDFFRHKSDLAKTIGFLQVGFKDERERNRFLVGSSDTLLSTSYEFYDWEVNLGSPDTAKNAVRVFYRQRTDWHTSTAENKLKNSTFAEWYGLSFEFIKNKNSQLRGKTAYRKLDITDTLLTTQKPDNTLVSRLEYTLRLFKGAVTSTTYYEIGTGLEQKREFVYLLVAAGQGVYAWIDYDGDNVKDLNEFEIAAFADQAEYIRVFTPSNAYAKTFTNQFNQVLNLKPVVLWGKKKGVLKFLTRFNNQTAFRIDRKTNNEELTSAYNPFIKNVADTSLLSLNSSVRNTVFFNRSSSKYGLDYTYYNVDGKSLLTSGFDTRQNRYHEGRVRWNLNQKFTLTTKGTTGNKAAGSDYLNGRNYTLNYLSTESRFSYQPGTAFRITFSGKYTEKDNDPELGAEKAILRDVGTEVRYNIVGKGSLLVNFNYINIYYDGLTNTSLAFEMLDALQVGQNLTWSMAYQRNLSKNMQLTLNYTGRTSQTTRTIHNGGVSVRAFF